MYLRDRDRANHNVILSPFFNFFLSNLGLDQGQSWKPRNQGLEPSPLPARVWVTRMLESGSELGIKPRNCDLDIIVFPGLLTTGPNAYPHHVSSLSLKTSETLNMFVEAVPVPECGQQDSLNFCSKIRNKLVNYYKLITV